MDDRPLLALLRCPAGPERPGPAPRALPPRPWPQRPAEAGPAPRCPECRPPAPRVQALPANLLLARLLDGLRLPRGGSLRRPGPLAPQDGPGGPAPRPSRPSLRTRADRVPRAKALCNYRGQSPGDLKFNKGDVILLQRQPDENWYQGEVNEVSDVFPASSVQVVKQLPQPPPLCRALYNFDLRNKDKGGNQDCLSFLKDDIITVISRVDENWAEGKLGEKVGIFPILFVEPNLTARHLLEKNKGRQPSRAKSQSPVPASRAKELHAPTLRRGPGSRRKGPGPFSITTALNTLNRMVHSPPGRPVLEIGTPVLISSSNPAVRAQHEGAGGPPGAPGQVSAHQPAPASPGQSTALVSLPSARQHLPASMFVALRPYAAHGPDELDVQEGDGVRVPGKHQDGRLRGVSLVTGRAGVLPDHHVIPVFRRASSFLEPRSAGLYAAWTLSASSVSSQGSFSDGDPRRSRPFKSVSVPTAIVSPLRSGPGPGTPGQGSLRKGRSSMRKNGSLQRPARSGVPALAAGSLKRSPAVAVRPQQPPFQPPSSPAAAAETGPRPAPAGDPALACAGRAGDSRAHSTASSLIVDGRDIPAKSDPLPKPPASAPPSILVKPENARNGTEKQVKTVRFQNHSPPPARHPGAPPGPAKPEQPAPAKGSQPEAAPSGAEGTVLFAHRAGCHAGQQTELRRKSAFGKAPSPLSTALATQTMFPTK